MPTAPDDVIDVTPTKPDEAPAAAPEPAEAIEPHQPEPEPPAQIIDPDGLVPTTGLSLLPAEQEMRNLAALANTLAMADACPKALRRKPNDVFLVLLTGRDLGVAPTAALRLFHVIEGTVTLAPKVQLAMVRRRPDLGRVWKSPDCSATGATWYSERADGRGLVISSEFTWDDATVAHLVDSRCTPYQHWKGNNQKCFCKDNWKNYPKRMLSWRALGYLLDDEYPEVVSGLYSADELGAITDQDGEPISVTGVEALPGMKRPQGQASVEGGQEADTDPAADPELLAGLIARTEVVKLHPEANEELKAWWIEREMPRIADLRQRQTTTLNARLSFLETKYDLIKSPPKAETPQSDAAPVEAPTADEAPAAAPADAEPLTGGQEPEAPEPEAEPTPAAEIGEQVTGKTPEPSADPADWVPTEPAGDLAGWLIARAQRMTGAEVKTAYTLAGEDPPTGNVQALRKAWASWQFDLHARAVVSALSLGIVGAALTLPDPPGTAS